MVYMLALDVPPNPSFPGLVWSGVADALFGRKWKA